MIAHYYKRQKAKKGLNIYENNPNRTHLSTADSEESNILYLTNGFILFLLLFFVIIIY